MFQSYAAIGDSFTEGVGDDLPGGQVRGWADLVALALARANAQQVSTSAASAPFTYANLAIRGRLLRPIIEEQLEPALALRPDLLSFNGGGNDIMRPRVDISWVVAEFERVVQRAHEDGVHLLLLSGANPSRNLPMGRLVQRRGDALAKAARELFRGRDGVTPVDNWSDAELTHPRYWSADKLHLNALGHTRVAGNVLRALGVAVPDAWADASEPASASERVQGRIAYYREYVVPWIGRRLTGRSSGDGRAPKRATLEPVELDR